jgi:hypothetical protein
LPPVERIFAAAGAAINGNCCAEFGEFLDKK